MLIDLARSPKPLTPQTKPVNFIVVLFAAPSVTPLQYSTPATLLLPLQSVLLCGSDEEPVDPKQELEERCKAPCTRPLKEYQACAKRIQGDDSGYKHCTGQYFDYWRCVDKCVATKLFTHLK